MKNKKTVLLLTIGLLSLSLMACGGKKEDIKDNLQQEGTQAQDQGSEWAYVPEVKSIEDENSLYNAIVKNDYLYYDKYQWNEATMQSSFSLVKYSLVDDSTEEIPIDIEEGSLNCYWVKKDGSVCGAVSYWSTDELTGDYNSKVTLAAFDKAGNIAMETELNEYLEGDSYISQILMDEQERIYLICGGKVVLFDAELKYCGKAQVAGMNDWINSAGVGKDGKVYVSYYGDNGMQLSDVNFDTKSSEHTYHNFVGGNGNFLATGIEKDFLIQNGNTLYEYDLQTESAEPVLDWLDCDINGQYVQNIGVLSDGRIWLCYNDWQANETGLVLLKKVPSSEVVKKETITIGTLYSDSDIQSAAVKFNKANDKYKITVNTYIDNSDWNENTYSDAITRLTNDITSGNGPDIIGLSGLNMEQLAAKDLFVDLYEYLDKSTKLGRDDFIDNILNGYTINDALIALPKTFSIETVVGKASDVGNKMGWSLSEMIAYADAHPDANLFDYEDKTNVLYYCMMYNEGTFIDWNTGKCNFDSPEFISLLEFVNRFPEEADFNNEVSTPTKIQNGEVLLQNVYLYDFNEIQIYNEMFGGEASYIGYPTTDGSVGCSISANALYAISSKSANQDGAWEFIESYLLEDPGNYWWGYPTRKEQLQTMIDKSLNVETYTWIDENGEEHEEFMGGGSVAYEDGWSYTYKPTTQHDVDIVLELMNVARPAVTTDDEVINIIREEAESFFKGGKSAADVASVIQSRVSIYVSENS